MPKLTLKQKREGVVNLYEVQMTVLIHHQSENDAIGYLRTALAEWSVGSSIIASVEFRTIEESNKRLFIEGVVYPEYRDGLPEDYK